MQTIHVSLTAIIIIIGLALLFDFMNGFHDAANAIATVVSTGVLKPQVAVCVAAFMNVIAIFIFDLHVATTVGKGIVDAAVVDHYIVFGALFGAIGWSIITWYYGIPSSSSHALVGGLIGATLAKSGASSLIASGILKIVAFIVIAPVLGFVFGSFMMLVLSWLFVRTPPGTVDRWGRRIQLITSSLYSLGHGGNDAQKTMGLIWMLLIASGYSMGTDHMPIWVIVACYGSMGFGTLFGGWRIVKTMGQKITKVRPIGGVCAETGGALTLFMATAFGIPVSTTHTITGAIVGVGASKKLSAVRWGVAGNIVWAWILTIPAAAMMSAIGWWLGTKIL